MEFNMLEVLTAQFFPDHGKTFGKGVTILRDGIKRFIQSHSTDGTVNILIISDLFYGGLKSLPVKGSNPGLDVLSLMQEALSKGANLGTAPSKIGSFLGEGTKARLLRDFNAQPDEDKGNFDLYGLYALLDELPLDVKKKWVIDRTVYNGSGSSGAQQSSPDTIIWRIESALGGIQRQSVFWDSNNPLPSSTTNCYDLIVMRRGICYCGKVSKGFMVPAACCGCARGDKSDVAFLKKIGAALKTTDKSAAYLAGWNYEGNQSKWTAAIQEFKETETDYTVQTVPAYKEICDLADDDTCISGVYMSRGRAFSGNKLKV